MPDNAYTEKEMRELIVATAKKWLGFKESNGSHQQIINLYNNHKPLAAGYKVKYTDAWCATYVSAVFIAAGLTSIAPTECSCERMIALYKAKGRWVEDESSYVPAPADIVMYDWQDNGVGDNKGTADHVGIVVSVNGNSMQIIEGNYGDAVAYRTLAVNGKTIRGYCLPDYGNAVITKIETKIEAKAPAPSGAIILSVTLPLLKEGSTGIYVGIAQAALNAMGYNCGAVDNDFGSKTDKAVRKFQTAKGLGVDGKIGKDTWAALLS